MVFIRFMKWLIKIAASSQSTTLRNCLYDDGVVLLPCSFSIMPQRYA